jgi:hypothetical protein
MEPTKFGANWGMLFPLLPHLSCFLLTHVSFLVFLLHRILLHRKSFFPHTLCV